ncbi:MAG: ComEC/Rec2 family competence protein [Pirellulales bacterium]|nr:ComEC/Rec2 family competence protein [Pirellulales bacterium]
MDESRGALALDTQGWARAIGRRDATTPTYEPLVPVALAAMLGIVFDRVSPVAGGTTLAAAVGLLGAWALARRSSSDRLAAWLLLGAVAALGCGWHHLRWQRFASDDIAGFAAPAARPVLVEFVALEQSRLVPPAAYDPLRIRPRGERTRVAVRVVSLRDGRLVRPASGRALLEIGDAVREILPGDRWRAWARLSRPGPPANPGEFDFSAYARADRQLARLSVATRASLVRVAPGSHWRPARWIAAARRQGDGFLHTALPAHRATLASALLLGLREQVGDERSEAFMRTGTIHVLSISGMHVGILAGSLFALLRLGWLPQRTAVVLIAAITCLYAWLADAQPPVVRAAILVVIVCLAAGLGRQALSFNSLAAAALVVLVLNPADLFRLGPQLSFVCVASLVWFSPMTRMPPPRDPLDRLIWETRPWSVRLPRGVVCWAWRLTLLSFCVWLVTLPLVAARFHLVSPLAPLLNTLLWLPVTILLLSGLSMLAAAIVLPVLAVPFTALCAGSIAVLDRLVTVVAAWPLDHYWVSGPREEWLPVLYGALTCWALLPRWRPARWMRWTFVAGWLLVAWVLPVPLPAGIGTGNAWQRPAPPQALRCTFLSVGHGCAVVLEMPHGEAWVYDIGQLGSPRRATDAVSQYLWTTRRRKVDALCLSHADVDHFNGAPELLERFEVRRVFITPSMFDDFGPALVPLDQALRAQRLRPEPVTAGCVLLAAPELRVEIISPPDQELRGRDNAESLVLLVEYLGHRILLTGDLEGEGVERLLAQEPLDCDVILAPHHGSNRSNPPGLARWSTPDWVVISSGPAPLDPELLDAYRSEGARVVTTATSGAIQFVVDRAGVRAETWRGRP